MLGTYNLNEIVVVKGEFRDPDTNALTDATTPGLVVEDPAGSRFNYSGVAVVHDSTGKYHVNVRATLPGTWLYRWEAPFGSGDVAFEGSWDTLESLLDSPEEWYPITAAQVWRRSKLDFAALGYSGAPELQPVVDAAKKWVEWATGRELDSTLDADLQPLAHEAVRMRVEQMVQRATPEQIGNQAAGVRSVSTGGLSITFADPARPAPGGARMVPSDWIALNDMLWPLMTEDRYDYWWGISTGVSAPAFSVQEVDWSAGSWGW